MNPEKQSLSEHNLNDQTDASQLRFGIIVSQWNRQVTDKLLEGCRDTLTQYGASDDNVFVQSVPGTFELPAAARMLDDRHNLDAVICLGCVIRGETKHNEYINQAVATGLVQLGVMRSKPFIFGVLTPNDMEQALARAGGDMGNKGIEAATTAISMAQLRQALRTQKKQIGFG